MIRREEVFYIGKVSKFRGINGDVEILFTDDAFDRGNADYLVLEMDGLLVPFFWTEYRFKNATTAIFSFEDIHDEKSARHIVGVSVFYPKSALTDDQSDNAALRSWQALTGFTLLTEDGVRLGEVESVDDSSANSLLRVLRDDNSELCLPFHEDFLVEASMKERVLVLSLPDGLLDLNG